LSGTFVSYTTQTIAAATATVNPAAGSCYVTESPVDFDPALLPHGDPLNAGFSVMASGLAGSLTADWVSPGNYAVTVTPATLPAGVYSLSGAGGPDIGPIRGTFTVTPAVRWTNAADYAGPIRTGQPMSFQWTGGDSGSLTTIRITSTNATLSTSILCNVPALSGSFIVPDYLARTIVQGQGNISVGSFSPAAVFSAAGLDAATVTTGASTTVKTSFLTPPDASN
jgi:hypothetical protein